MSEPSDKKSDLEQSANDPVKITSYQTNKVPLLVHLMWATFTIAAVIYMLVLGLPDFIRWW